MPQKIKIGDLVQFNCEDWMIREIEADMEYGYLTVKCLAKDKLHLRLINELETQKLKIKELEEKLIDATTN